MTLYKKVFIALSLFTLIGCVKADRSKESLEFTASGYDPAENLISVNNRALFEAGNITLENRKFSNTRQGDWREVDHLQLSFKLCGLRDRASQGTLRNEKFNISSELGSDITWKEEGDGVEITNPVVITSENCLEWSQTIRYFDFFAPSVNLVLHYEIESLSGNLGKMIKRIYINPWDMQRNQSQSNGWLDITNKARADWGTGEFVMGADNIVAALKGEYETQNNHRVRLQMNSFNVEPSEQDQTEIRQYNARINEMSEEERQTNQRLREAHLAQTGTKIRMNMSARPFVRVEDSTGVLHDIPITSGDFHVTMTLLARGATNDGKFYRLAEDLTFSDRVNYSSKTWPVRANGLLASVPMALRLDSSYGRVILAVRIEPPSEMGIEPFMATYDLGEHNQWVRRQAPPFSVDEDQEPMDEIQYAEFINSAVPVDLEAAATMREAELFWFSPLRLRFVRIMPGETATDRTLQYSATTCVSHGLYRSRVGQGLQFDITTYDKPGPGVTDPRGRKYSIRRQTNEDGCLTWFGFLSHKYYHKEVLEYKTADVRFTGTYDQQGEYVETDEWKNFVNQYEKQFEYYMNPWDEKWTFGWDKRDMPEGYIEEIQKQEEDAIPSKLFIADFKYETMGFRYEVDRYMNLKVKKAVLLKAYPYVLKYNSIVLGRNGTEKLRDGVYLMKVALQKDYLDPAAEGLRIYDTERVDQPLAAGESVASHPLAEFRGRPVGGYTDSNGNPSRQGHVPVDQIGPGKKEYISIQKKLVRVLGGMIITPIEFDVEDLRLMRIRNQFYIQLQTIDEHKLRLANLLDEALSGMQTEADVLTHYQTLFESMDQLADIDNYVELNELLNKQQGDLDLLRLSSVLDQLQISRQEAERRIYEVLGFADMDFESTTFQERKQFIADQLAEINRYRALGYTASDRYSNAAQTRFRNQKRTMIDNMLTRFGAQAEQVMNTDWTEGRDQEYLESVNNDPMQRYFYLGASGSHNQTLRRIMDYHIEKAAEQRGGGETALEELRTLKIADFTQSSLAPNFSLDLLLNDGLEKHQSGLPARTFVGPLTFVYNTNGSSLRPTDNLEESYCPTATCSEVARVESNFSQARQPNPENEEVDPMPEIDTPRVVGLDVQGRVTNNPIYRDGDSANFSNETNRYYGSLRAYSNRTFEDDPDSPESNGLIKDKQRLNDSYIRKMEKDSQIINFVKTLGLKHVLLNEDPQTNERSRLKQINERCVRTKNLNQIQSCFTDLGNSEYSMDYGEFFDLINKRKGPRVWHKGASFVRDVNEGAYWSDGARSHAGGMREYASPESEITTHDLVRLMRWGANKTREQLTEGEKEKEQEKPQEEQLWPLDENQKRLIFHRMCFALTQKFFTQNYFDKAPPGRFALNGGGLGVGPEGYNNRVVHELEEDCHKYTDNFFENREEPLGEVDTRIYNPIIFERKARVFDTTGQYIYRGGKSLNINLSASFSLSHSRGFSVSSTGSFKPWELVKDIASKASGVLRSIVGGLGFSVSYTNSEAVSESDVTTVSSGTFLVSQQASFVIELGQYERCVVARLNPKILDLFFEQSNWLKPDFNPQTDVDTQGLMICEGKIVSEPLPVNENYYYFTQHFTEGDMLDMADLNNHPWLLQLRGYRDFQTFVSMIGANEVRYTDQNVVNNIYETITTDLQAMNASNANEGLKMEVVSQEEDINWPLEALSETYFKVLPTFPGIYTFIDGADTTPNWPYDNQHPGEAFEASDQD